MRRFSHPMSKQKTLQCLKEHLKPYLEIMQDDLPTVLDDVTCAALWRAISAGELARVAPLLPHKYQRIWLFLARYDVLVHSTARVQ